MQRRLDRHHDAVGHPGTPTVHLVRFEPKELKIQLVILVSTSPTVYTPITVAVCVVIGLGSLTSHTGRFWGLALARRAPSTAARSCHRVLSLSFNHSTHINVLAVAGALTFLACHDPVHQVQV